jgi:ribosomal protein L12E/L44/L45/RPP1/RPP2
MWSNEYNALRKKQMLGQDLTPDEQTKYADYEQKLLANGGAVPPISKSLVQAVAEAKGVPIEEVAAQYGVSLAPAVPPAPAPAAPKKGPAK